MKEVVLTQEIIKDLIDYDPDTGIIVWKKRPLKYFSDGKKSAQVCANMWNGRHAGKPAGDLDSNGYLRISIFYKRYQAHRIAWLYVHGSFPEEYIDHINRNKTDNRMINLREVSPLENNRNMKLPVHNKSGVMGVCWNTKQRKWQANIRVKQKTINLGQFDDKEDAIAARKAANIKYGFHENHGKTI